MQVPSEQAGGAQSLAIRFRLKLPLTDDHRVPELHQTLPDRRRCGPGSWPDRAVRIVQDRLASGRAGA